MALFLVLYSSPATPPKSMLDGTRSLIYLPTTVFTLLTHRHPLYAFPAPILNPFSGRPGICYHVRSASKPPMPHSCGPSTVSWLCGFAVSVDDDDPAAVIVDSEPSPLASLHFAP